LEPQALPQPPPNSQLRTKPVSSPSLISSGTTSFTFGIPLGLKPFSPSPLARWLIFGLGLFLRVAYIGSQMILPHPSVLIALFFVICLHRFYNAWLSPRLGLPSLVMNITLRPHLVVSKTEVSNSPSVGALVGGLLRTEPIMRLSYYIKRRRRRQKIYIG